MQRQGPILNFQLKAPDGSPLSYRTFEREAAGEWMLGPHVMPPCYFSLGKHPNWCPGGTGMHTACFLKGSDRLFFAFKLLGCVTIGQFFSADCLTWLLRLDSMYERGQSATLEPATHTLVSS
eukprot:1141470-Pelagomonas_calceolata.AAC.4